MEDDSIGGLTTVSTKHQPNREVPKLVIPKSLVNDLIKDLHALTYDDLLGKARFLYQARSECYWLTKRKDKLLH